VGGDEAAEALSEARVQAAAAVRELVHALAGRDADEATLDEVARTVRALVPRLERAPRRARVIPTFDEISARPEVDGGSRRYAMADRAVVGPANPTSIDVLSTRRDGDDSVTEVMFGPAFEGALGRVHGGMVAAVFDDLTGFVLAFVGRPGFSGRLDVTFRAPVPTEVPIEFRVRLRDQQGRKLFVEGEATLDGQVLATAEVVMITVGQEHFETHAQELLARDPTEASDRGAGTLRRSEPTRRDA
jgi:acyl-coenzyme A thioesterase PaaI-like protein